MIRRVRPVSGSGFIRGRFVCALWAGAGDVSLGTDGLQFMIGRLIVSLHLFGVPSEVPLLW